MNVFITWFKLLSLYGEDHMLRGFCEHVVSTNEAS